MANSFQLQTSWLLIDNTQQLTTPLYLQMGENSEPPSPQGRVCMCCSKHAVTVRQHSSTGAGPQTPADHTHIQTHMQPAQPLPLAPKGLKEL